MRLAPVALVVSVVALGATSAFVAHARADDAKFDLDLEDADVRDVIKEIQKHTDQSIVPVKDVAGKITVHLARVTWKDALDHAAKLAGCTVEYPKPNDPPVIYVKKVGVAPGPNPLPGPAKVAFREYPIGEEVERAKEHLKVAAVWLPPVTMDHEHGAAPGPDTIHLECDIHALKGNENGFAVGDWIPYLSIAYEITAKGETKPCLTGDLMPMVAKDGPHYGATIAMPGPGEYTLVYKIDPPSKNGLGRHTDAITGVAEWWKPFETSYAWNFRGLK